MKRILQLVLAGAIGGSLVLAVPVVASVTMRGSSFANIFLTGTGTVLSAPKQTSLCIGSACWTSNAGGTTLQTSQGFIVAASANAAVSGAVQTNSLQSYDGSSVITVTPGSTKGLKIATSGAQPTCDSTVRNQLFIVQGGAGVKDSVAICQKDAGDAYAWRTIY